MSGIAAMAGVLSFLVDVNCLDLAGLCTLNPFCTITSLAAQKPSSSSRFVTVSNHIHAIAETMALHFVMFLKTLPTYDTGYSLAISAAILSKYVDVSFDMSAK